MISLADRIEARDWGWDTPDILKKLHECTTNITCYHRLLARGLKSELTALSVDPDITDRYKRYYASLKPEFLHQSGKFLWKAPYEPIPESHSFAVRLSDSRSYAVRGHDNDDCAINLKYYPAIANDIVEVGNALLKVYGNGTRLGTPFLRFTPVVTLTFPGIGQGFQGLPYDFKLGEGIYGQEHGLQNFTAVVPYNGDGLNVIAAKHYAEAIKVYEMTANAGGSFEGAIDGGGRHVARHLINPFMHLALGGINVFATLPKNHLKKIDDPEIHAIVQDPPVRDLPVAQQKMRLTLVWQGAAPKANIEWPGFK